MSVRQEEAHQLHHSPSSSSSLPPSFPLFFLPLHPPVSPPLACRTLGFSSSSRGGGDGGRWCSRSSDFYLCRHNKRDEKREREKNTSALLLPVLLLRLQLPPSLSSPRQFMGSSRSLRLPPPSHSLSPLSEKKQVEEEEKNHKCLCTTMREREDNE